MKEFNCPKCNATAKRHRRRNFRYQFYCEICKRHFTQDSKQQRVLTNPKYEEFFWQYIGAKGRLVISKLCNDLKLSRATIYRYIIIADVLIQIIKWARDSELFSSMFLQEGGLKGLDLPGNNDYKIENLHIDVIPLPKLNKYGCIIKISSNETFAFIWPEKDHIVKQKDHKMVEIYTTKPFNEFDLPASLAPLRSLKRRD